MRIEYDVKLDFKDVLIRPKRNILRSRSEVSLEREFHFKLADVTWHGIPIIAANMDHTGTFAMAEALSEHKLLTAIDKFSTLDEWQGFATKSPAAVQSSFVSIGIAEHDFEKARDVINAANVPMICL